MDTASESNALHNMEDSVRELGKISRHLNAMGVFRPLAARSSTLATTQNLEIRKRVYLLKPTLPLKSLQCFKPSDTHCTRADTKRNVLGMQCAEVEERL
jgi:hypothetical protein